MANIYSDMGRFLQESFNIESTFKESLKEVCETGVNLDASSNVNESFEDARPGSTKIRNFIEMGADPADILDELLRFLPDGATIDGTALADFADYYGENFLGIGDDWE